MMENIKIEDTDKDLDHQAVQNDMLDFTTTMNVEFKSEKLSMDSIKIEVKEQSADEVSIKSECFIEMEEQGLGIEDEEIDIEPNQNEYDRCNSGLSANETKEDLTGHGAEHAETNQSKIYRCPQCDYFSQDKSHYNRHMIIHKSDAEIFGCPHCTFKTKHKDYLKKHIDRHTNRKVYKCPLCPFETFYRGNLRLYHQLTHKSDAEVRIYQCEICPYKGKNINAIRKHQWIHKEPDELVMYKCEKCSFQTKYVSVVRRHRQVHQESKELDMIQCNLCPYQARTKNHLRTHMKFAHPNPDDVKIYSCKHCSYTSKFAAHVKRHSRIHLKPEEIDFHNCNICTFKSKAKYGLKQHFKRVHEQPSKEKKWYKCDHCDLQFRQKPVLTRHMACHQDSEQTNSTSPVKINKKLFYCYNCPYHTKNKDNLKRHLLRHRKGFYHRNK